MSTRFRVAATLAVILAVGDAPGMAQTVPTSSGSADLLTPPELRGTPAASPPPRGTPPRQRGKASAAARAVASPSRTDGKPRPADPADPIDVGIAVRGDGGHHIYSATGADQSNGTGATVGVRFGF